MKGGKESEDVLSGGHDAPITNAKDDLFGAGRTAGTIQRTIRAAPAAWSTRIGLYGAWGSGKTSILNLLELLEKRDNSIVVRFSAWSAVGESGVLILFYEALKRQFGLEGIQLPTLGRAKRLVSKGQWLGRLLKWFGSRVEKLAPVPEGTSDAVAGLAESAFAWFAIDRKDIDAMVERLKGRRVVVFIDDLDRADPRLIPKTLLALRELLDWPGFSFVLAFDRRVVARALSEYSQAYGENAQLFLEKVVDVPFDVPAPGEPEKVALAVHAFEACCPFIPADVVNAVKAHLPDEPRRIKLVARKIGILARVAERHGQDELDWLALVLYNLVHEASPEAAMRAVEVATATQDTWALHFAGDEAERSKAQEIMRSSLESVISADTKNDTQRVVSAALALLERWKNLEADQIKYLVGLVFDEPAFTRKEVSATIERWMATRDDAQLKREIADAATRGNVTQVQAASNFLELAVRRYAECLTRMAESATEFAHANSANEATSELTFLEHVWLQCDELTICEAKRTGPVVMALVSTVSRWVGWTRNAGESSLRQREADLALAAALSCDDQENIYASTDPFWESHHDGADSPRAHWRALLRSRLNTPIGERLFARFSRLGGIEGVAQAQDDDSLATWMLESPKSPVYVLPDLTEKFEQQFALRDDADDNSALVLRDNAKLYLHMLLHQARSGSWAGAARLKEIHDRRPTLIPAAWAAVVRCRVPFRMASSLLKLKADLVAAGVPAAALIEPEWLITAGRELKTIPA